MSRQKAVYITQYGGWWAATPYQWFSIVVRMRTPPDQQCISGVYDLDKDAKPLLWRPNSIRVADDGRSYWDCKGHEIKRPLNWTPEDWDYELEQLLGSKNPE